MNIARHALLAVTDDHKTLETLRELLGDEQPLEAAGSAQEAVETARSGGSALILVDTRAKGLDLGEFCRQLKNDARTSGIPVLGLAASDQEAAATIALGVSDCLAVPVEPRIARARIRNYTDLGRCIEALRRFSLVDGVTGIANRHRFEEFLALEWRRNFRNQTPLSLVIMELDHFGAYLEHYGRTAGDECLKRIATAFQDATQRPGDLIALYAWNGFACVLPETDTLGAVSVAERMRAELATLAIPHAKSPAACVLTMSVGTATRVPSRDLNLEPLVETAASNLKEAQQAGGDRVTFGR